jgi:hypothetical protein
MARVFTSFPKVKGSNFMGGVVCVVNYGMLTKYSPIEFLKLVHRLIMWPTHLG